MGKHCSHYLHLCNFSSPPVYNWFLISIVSPLPTPIPSACRRPGTVTTPHSDSGSDTVLHCPCAWALPTTRSQIFWHPMGGAWSPYVIWVSVTHAWLLLVPKLSLPCLGLAAHQRGFSSHSSAQVLRPAPRCPAPCSPTRAPAFWAAHLQRRLFSPCSCSDTLQWVGWPFYTEVRAWTPTTWQWAPPTLSCTAVVLPSHRL